MRNIPTRNWSVPRVLACVAANRWLRAGIDIATVSNWLGHTSLETTKLYLKAIQQKSPATQRLVDRVWKS